MPSERQAPAIDDAGGLAARDLSSAAARVGRVEKAAAVLDHEPQRSPRPRDALTERVLAAVEDFRSLAVGQAQYVGEHVRRALRPRQAQEHPVGAADPDLLGEQPVLGLLERRVDVPMPASIAAAYASAPRTADSYSRFRVRRSDRIATV